MTQQIVQLKPHGCPQPCTQYNQDSVICNEEPDRCVLCVCPQCTKIVPHTPYCLNCAGPLHDARKAIRGRES